jgi:hypothetical protein
VRGQVQKILLFLAGRRQALEIRGIDDHVTGRAGHHTFARPLERLTRCPRDVEQSLSRVRFHFLVQ